MKLLTIAAISALSILPTTAAFASAHTDNPLLMKLLDDPVFDDYAKIEVKIRSAGIFIEAHSAGSELERVYSPDGVLLKEEVTTADGQIERKFVDGVLVTEEFEDEDEDHHSGSGHDDDDDDDDHDGDDSGHGSDDDDDSDDDNSGHGSDND